MNTRRNFFGALLAPLMAAIAVGFGVKKAKATTTLTAAGDESSAVAQVPAAPTEGPVLYVDRELDIHEMVQAVKAGFVEMPSRVESIHQVGDRCYVWCEDGVYELHKDLSYNLVAPKIVPPPIEIKRIPNPYPVSGVQIQRMEREFEPTSDTHNFFASQDGDIVSALPKGLAKREGWREITEQQYHGWFYGERERLEIYGNQWTKEQVKVINRDRILGDRA